MMEMFPVRMLYLATRVEQMNLVRYDGTQIKSCVFENGSFINRKYHGLFAVIVCGSIDISLVLCTVLPVFVVGGGKWRGSTRNSQLATYAYTPTPGTVETKSTE